MIMNNEQSTQTKLNTLPSNRALIILFMSIAVLTYLSVTLHDYWQQTGTFINPPSFMQKIFPNN